MKSNKLQHDVVIESHGMKYVITQERNKMKEYSAQGIAPFLPEEIEILRKSTNGEKLSKEHATSLFKVKIQFPESEIGKNIIFNKGENK